MRKREYRRERQSRNVSIYGGTVVRMSVSVEKLRREACIVGGYQSLETGPRRALCSTQEPRRSVRESREDVDGREQKYKSAAKLGLGTLLEMKGEEGRKI